MFDYQTLGQFLVPVFSAALGFHNAKIRELTKGRDEDRQSILALTLRVAELTGLVSHLTEDREALRAALAAAQVSEARAQETMRRELEATRVQLESKQRELDEALEKLRAATAAEKEQK